MDILQNILESLETNEFPHLREFDQYALIKAIGAASQQGKVVKAENSIKRQYAIKFYRPQEVESGAMVKGVEDFNREVKMIISLNHKNIVKVHTAGRAKWDGKRWSVRYGFDTALLEKNELLFFVMDYIVGDDISALFPGQGETKDNVSPTIGLFEDMCQQVIAAFEHLHEYKVTHKDIKPDNIRYSVNDNTFILVDFGLARPYNYQPHNRPVLTEYVDFPSIIAQKDGDAAHKERAARLNDLAQFCLVLIKLLPRFRSDYDDERYEGISDCLKKATDHDLDKRYNNVSEFGRALCTYFVTVHPWKFDLKLHEFLCSGGLKQFQFCRKLRIPVSGSILVPDAVRSIIDTPEFQRLRGTKQLGPTAFVFPGANHTRFEHSLGAYYLSLRYLESLVNLPHFREICEPIDETIKYIALSALLHDIGHYTFSHWIEEITGLPDEISITGHEYRAEEVISTSGIKDIIENQWGVDAACVYRIIANSGTTERELLINSIIDSIIGVDRVDYLTRDSVHCGVSYGRGIDIDRLLDSLYVDLNNKKICLTDKGLSCLQSIISCRNVMYREVYWHKTVRACDAMLKRLFFEYVNSKIDDMETIYAFLTSSDDYFINVIYNKVHHHSMYSGIAKLAKPFAFGGRALYKPAFVYSTLTKTKESQGAQSFFDMVIKENSYATLVKWSGLLAEKLGHGMSPTDIILEKTPLKPEEEAKLQDFRIWNIRKKRFENYPIQLNALNQQIDSYVQAYVFCAPEYYEYIVQLDQPTGSGTTPSKLDLIFADVHKKIRKR